MAVVKNRFTDPESGDTYDWHLNNSWEGEDRVGTTVPVTWTSLTGTGLPIPQVGEAQPDVWTLRGTILELAQHTEFLAWVELSTQHTIFFRDWMTAEYEVLIVSYKANRVGVAANRNDPTNMPLNIIRYEMQLAIIGPAP